MYVRLCVSTSKGFTSFFVFPSFFYSLLFTCSKLFSPFQSLQVHRLLKEPSFCVDVPSVTSLSSLHSSAAASCLCSLAFFFFVSFFFPLEKKKTFLHALSPREPVLPHGTQKSGDYKILKAATLYNQGKKKEGSALSMFLLPREQTKAATWSFSSHA